MALVKYGGGIVQMSGSIAGDTHARNRYGNYIRARTKPVNPNTEAQDRVRASLSSAVDRWSQVLTANQRIAWNLYGSNVVMTNKLGESINLTGFNHYVRSASLYIRNGNAPIDDGPVVFELPDADPAFAVTCEEAGQTISITFNNALLWANEDVGRMFVFMGSPQNPQRNFFAGPWKYVHSINGAALGPPASPEAGNAIFAVSEGQRVWFYARILRADGRISQQFYADTFCAA